MFGQKCLQLHSKCPISSPLFLSWRAGCTSDTLTLIDHGCKTTVVRPDGSGKHRHCCWTGRQWEARLWTTLNKKNEGLWKKYFMNIFTILTCWPTVGLYTHRCHHNYVRLRRSLPCTSRSSFPMCWCSKQRHRRVCTCTRSHRACRNPCHRSHRYSGTDCSNRHRVYIRGLLCSDSRLKERTRQVWDLFQVTWSKSRRNNKKSVL